MVSTKWSRYADPVDELVAVWREKGIALHAGASDEDLNHFERVHKLQLPPDFRRLYRLANGMPDYNEDDFALSVWSLKRMEREHAEFVASKEAWPYVVFSDWLVGSHSFALRLLSDGKADVVVLWCPDPILDEVVADSMKGFATLYLANRLHGVHDMFGPFPEGHDA